MELVAGGNLSFVIAVNNKVIAVPKTLIDCGGRGGIAVSVCITMYCEVERQENCCE
jgi:hypothetical protein